MCKIQYRNSVNLKVLISGLNLRGRRPISDFVQELEKKMLRRHSDYGIGHRCHF